MAGNGSQNKNMFVQKNLIVLLYYDPIADVCIYDLTLFYSVSFYFCIFLLYRTDLQVEVQIRILLNSLSAKSVLAGEKLVATYSISM